MAENEDDQWAWYYDALADPKEIGKSIPVHDSANSGYFRVKAKDKRWEPVGIWIPENMDQHIALRGNREVDPAQIWSYACRYPVTYENYIAAVETGKWPDDDDAVAAQLAPPKPGHNSGDVSEEDELRDQIESALAGVDKYKTVNDEETASKALSLRNRLNELSGSADKKREELKRPHLEAGKKVDSTWQPLVKGAKEGADRVKRAIEAYADRKRAKEREEARIREEEIARTYASPEPQSLVTDQPEPKDAAPVQVRATYGRAAAIKVKIVVDTVPDWKALAVYMAHEKDCQDVLLKLAQRYLDAGRTDVPVKSREASKI